MHYKGQIFELSVPASDGVLDDGKARALEERFGQEHERTYGHRAGPDEPVVLVTAQLIGRGLPDHQSVPDRLISPADGEPRAATTRRAYFGPDQGWLETDVIARAAGRAPERAVDRRRIRRDLHHPAGCCRGL